MIKNNKFLRKDFGVEVYPQSIKSIRHLASAIRSEFGIPNNRSFPIAEFLESALPQIDEDFQLQILNDNEMQGTEGVTYPQKHLIRLKESVYLNLMKDDGRARFTACHEMGHLLLHQKFPPEFKRNPCSIKEIYKSSEWQADTFAYEILMPYEAVLDCQNATEISRIFKTSYSAALVRLEKIKKPIRN